MTSTHITDGAVAADAEVLKEPRNEPWGMREFGLRSPDGHRFMVGQRILADIPGNP